MSKEEVENILINLSKIKVNDKQLISIKEGPDYPLFDMPAHRSFLENIGFKKYKSYKGWRALRGYLNQRDTGKVYLYPKLDQYELLEKLESLPKEELENIKKEDLKYPWMLKNVNK